MGMYRENRNRKCVFLERYYATEVKIIEGAARPMTAEEPLFFLKFMEHGLGPIIPPEMRICKRENFCELIKLVSLVQKILLS